MWFIGNSSQPTINILEDRMVRGSVVHFEAPSLHPFCGQVSCSAYEIDEETKIKIRKKNQELIACILVSEKLRLNLGHNPEEHCDAKLEC